jgi:hypothetical protein
LSRKGRRSLYLDATALRTFQAIAFYRVSAPSRADYLQQGKVAVRWRWVAVIHELRTATVAGGEPPERIYSRGGVSTTFQSCQSLAMCANLSRDKAVIRRMSIKTDGSYAERRKMSRLYYDNPALSAHEMTWPRAPWSSRKQFNIEEKGSDSATVKSYLEKVAKLVPSEVVAAYLTLVGFVSAVKNLDIHSLLYVVIFLFCEVMTHVYLYIQIYTSKQCRTHLILSSIAFAVWAYATSGGSVVPQLYDPAISSIALISFGLISGAIPLKR